MTKTMKGKLVVIFVFTFLIAFFYFGNPYALGIRDQQVEEGRSSLFLFGGILIFLALVSIGREMKKRISAALYISHSLHYNQIDMKLTHADASISTAQLSLQPVQAKDVEGLFEILQKYPEVAKFLPWNPPQDIEETKSFIEYALASFPDKEIVWGIFYENKIIGLAGFHDISLNELAWKTRHAKIGYWISPEFQKKGLGTEIAQAIVKFGFEKLKLKKIKARVIAGNSASERIICSLGFRFIGIQEEHVFFDKQWWHARIYELLAKNFQPDLLPIDLSIQQLRPENVSKIQKFKVLSREMLVDVPYCRIEKQRVLLPNGTEADWFLKKSSDAVIVIPFLKNGEVALLETYKHGAGITLYEFPSGIINDSEDPKMAAARELREETGLVSEHLQSIGCAFADATGATMKYRFFIAKDCEPIAPQELDDAEQIRVFTAKNLNTAISHLADSNHSPSTAATLAALPIVQRFLASDKGTHCSVTV